MAVMKWKQPVKTSTGGYRYESRDGRYSVDVIANGFALYFNVGGKKLIDEYKTFMAANKGAVNHSQGNPKPRQDNPKPNPFNTKSINAWGNEHIIMDKYKYDNPFRDQVDKVYGKNRARYSHLYKGAGQ